MCVLTLSDPESEETEEADECCWGLEMDMGESALWGETESLCCSSELTLPPSTQPGSCSETGSLGGETRKEKEELRMDGTQKSNTHKNSTFYLVDLIINRSVSYFLLLS